MSIGLGMQHLLDESALQHDDSLMDEKAYEASENGATVVCVVPSPAWSRWHTQLMKCKIRFIEGRFRIRQFVQAALRSTASW